MHRSKHHLMWHGETERLRLMTSSTLVGNSTGRSPGLLSAPLACTLTNPMASAVHGIVYRYGLGQKIVGLVSRASKSLPR
jgi:hypothetical protein